MPEVTGNEGSFVTIAAGGTLTAEFRKNFSSQPTAILFGKNKLSTLCAETGYMGLRMYFGQDINGNLTLVVVSVDSNDNDITTHVLDTGVPCPTYCSNANGLNS